MKCLLLRLGLLAVLVLVAKLAVAAGPVGRWTVDEEAMRTQMRTIVDSQLAGLTEEQRRMAAPMIDARIEEMLAGLRGTAEFRPDGRVEFTDPDGRRESGRWEASGDEIRVHVGDREAPMIGRLADGRMRLGDPSAQHEGMPAPQLVLRRLPD